MARAPPRPVPRRSRRRASSRGLVSRSWSPSHRRARRRHAARSRGPYLTGLSDSAVEVRFELDAAAPARWSSPAEGDPGAPRSRRGRPVGRCTSSTSTGLAAGQGVRRTTVRSAPAPSRARATSRPRRAPAPGAPATFLVYGDNRSDETAHAALVRAMRGDAVGLPRQHGRHRRRRRRTPPTGSRSSSIEAPLLARPRRSSRASATTSSTTTRRAPPSRATSASAMRRGSPASPTARCAGATRASSSSTGCTTGSRARSASGSSASSPRRTARPGLVWRIAVVHHGPWSSGPHGGNAKLLVRAHPGASRRPQRRSRARRARPHLRTRQPGR